MTLTELPESVRRMEVRTNRFVNGAMGGADMPFRGTVAGFCSSTSDHPNVSSGCPLSMNQLSQTGVIMNFKAGESSWNKMFYAHPHPGPLPRGEGETVAASGQKCSALVHGYNAGMFLENLSPRERVRGNAILNSPFG